MEILLALLRGVEMGLPIQGEVKKEHVSVAEKAAFLFCLSVKRGAGLNK
jgi:hypothetical protein